MSDRIAVMKDGKIIEQGLASRIITSPASPYTQSLLDAADELYTDVDDSYVQVVSHYHGYTEEKME
jgi:ABC-type dipeptide/oligopeptide/nickel transport system ATPase component